MKAKRRKRIILLLLLWCFLASAAALVLSQNYDALFRFHMVKRNGDALQTIRGANDMLLTDAEKQEKYSQKVFGIGLSKTGTTSLHKALQMLGFKSAKTPLSFISKVIGGRANDTFVLNAKRVYKYFSERRLQATTDLPIPLFFIPLSKLYPNAKFILTTRNLDEWRPSARKEMSSNVSGLVKTNRIMAYGAPTYTEPQYPNAFLSHERAVRDYFAHPARRQRLLVWNLLDDPSWTTLCDFLDGVPTPPSAPFPHQNNKKKNAWRDQEFEDD